MKIHVIVCSGEYKGADRTKLLEAYTDYEKAQSRLKSNPPIDVPDPEDWGVRFIDVKSVELKAAF